VYKEDDVGFASKGDKTEGASATRKLNRDEVKARTDKENALRGGSHNFAMTLDAVLTINYEHPVTVRTDVWQSPEMRVQHCKIKIACKGRATRLAAYHFFADSSH